MASFLKKLSLARGPLRRVVLLPDHLFFARVIATSGDVAVARGEAELALEALSPFPLAQLYYGFFHVEGSSRALIYAAYRRRFATEVAADWKDANLVLPAFASVLGRPSDGIAGATWLIHGENSLVAVRWDDQAVPADVQIRPVFDEENRPAVRDALLLELTASERIRELHELPVANENSTGPEFEFIAGESTFVVTPEQAADLDVRDKTDLQQLRRAQARDRALWRVFLVCLAAIGLAMIGELTLAAGRVWQTTRVTRVMAQRPIVDAIMTAQSLTHRIDELSTKRLRPFEMLGIVGGAVRPKSIQFLRTTTDGLYRLEIQAQTESATDISTYRAGLVALPGIEKVDLYGPDTRGRMATFRMVVSFKPEALNTSMGEK
ncbi:hypothetical protein K0B96_13660 [Horticoccus luteus]|uniref:Uncharacterized protein n=1 Tax=Horticoccus luteus TaxID=2862869 RepID=A0A8F9XJ65_9BACT|nr:hypothetical protein [Horticoccus luteus]QYM78338.1 hypothetical protein K0B96_13660 [Horticoccus luteus]